MIRADTPMPGEDPGTLIEDEDRLNEIEPVPKDGKTEQRPSTVDEETPGSDDAEQQRA